MCGISGIIGSNWAVKHLMSMVDEQTHRGPNDSGIFINPNNYAGLGHNRLSIIDLSSSAKHPMHDVSNRFTIVFNGEIYNYIELKQELSDYPFRTNSDTEVILAAYHKWGEECVTHLIGMFAFAIWDEQQQALFCSRDRLGIKPFYYHQSDGNFIFASEIKALLATGVKPVPNWNQWSTYLNYGYSDHSNETFFKEIYSLQPGNNLCLQNGSSRVQRYWNLNEHINTLHGNNYQECIGELQELLTDSIKLHLRSDVPVSVNLSSGLDSGLLASMVDSAFTDKTKYTFTSAFSDLEFDESQHIPKLGLTNFESIKKITLPENIPSLATELIWHQEAPFGGIPSIAYYDLHKTIREHQTPVSLEGQGLDELFAGYEYSKIYYYADIVKNQGWSVLQSHFPNSLMTSQLINNINSVLNNQPILMSQDATTHLRNDALSQDLIQNLEDIPKFEQPFQDHLSNILYQDLMHTKLPRVLRMNDKLSMATGTELRVPFLDHRLVEFAFSMNPAWKIKNNQGKSILRDLSKDWMPKEWYSQRKRSVVTPQTQWLKKELSNWAEEILNSNSFKTRGIFDHSNVLDLYRQFKSSSQSNSFYVWQWINTELWFRTFID